MIMASRPETWDVLCCKEKTYDDHSGNLLFRQMISTFKSKYQEGHSKNTRMDITKQIVKTLKYEYKSRFLRLTTGASGNRYWVEISDQQARDKTSHALRFACNENGKYSGSTKKVKRDFPKLGSHCVRAPERIGSQDRRPLIRRVSDASTLSASSNCIRNNFGEKAEIESTMPLCYDLFSKNSNGGTHFIQNIDQLKDLHSAMLSAPGGTTQVQPRMPCAANEQYQMDVHTDGTFHNLDPFLPNEQYQIDFHTDGTFDILDPFVNQLLNEPIGNCMLDSICPKSFK